MRSGLNGDGDQWWTLIGGGRLESQGRIEHPGDEQRDYDTYWLFLADAARDPIELWCDVRPSEGS